MRLFLLLAFTAALAACDDGHKSNVNAADNGVIDCRANPDECAIDLNDNR